MKMSLAKEALFGESASGFKGTAEERKKKMDEYLRRKADETYPRLKGVLKGTAIGAGLGAALGGAGGAILKHKLELPFSVVPAGALSGAVMPGIIGGIIGGIKGRTHARRIEAAKNYAVLSESEKRKVLPGLAMSNRD
jgi:hypothetical protein